MIQPWNQAPLKIIEGKRNIVLNSPGRISEPVLSVTPDVIKWWGEADSCVWNEKQKQQNILPERDVTAFVENIILQPWLRQNQRTLSTEFFPDPGCCSLLSCHLRFTPTCSCPILLSNLTARADSSMIFATGGAVSSGRAPSEGGSTRGSLGVMLHIISTETRFCC